MSDSDPRRDVEMTWGVRIPLRDGVHLSATLYRPCDRRTPRPAIFTLTPYTGQTYHERGVYFAMHGYVFLTVDVRGRANSEGKFRPINEGYDGADVVRWLAEQPYCDGQVAMWGGSYGGYVQWATVKEHPPQLATVVPVAAPYRGVDSPMRNNMFVAYTTQWLTLVSGRASQEKIFEDTRGYWNPMFRRWFEAGIALKGLDSFIGNPSELFQEWLAHPQQDAYWDSYSPTSEQFASLTLPILTITGIYDSDQAGALAYYRRHLEATPGGGANHYLVIGPWDHAGTRTPKSEFGGLQSGDEGVIDLGRLHLDWYAWTLDGGPKPEFLRKKISYYVMNADKWCYAERLEEVTARVWCLFLNSTQNPSDVFCSGSLSADPPTEAAPDHYTYDPRDLSTAELESTLDPNSLVDQRQVYDKATVHLIYHSRPFIEALEVVGFFRLSVWLAIDQPDTDFRVHICEIRSDGTSVMLGVDTLRARYRESLRKQTLIETQEPLLYEFCRFNFIARRIERGSRLRLTLGPINSIFSEKNYNTGGIVSEESVTCARVVTVRLFHDSTRPSALYVPVGRSYAFDK
jgi:putative CocE/NonD family hydrolase